MARNKQMDDEELTSLVGLLFEQSINYTEGELSYDRSQYLKAYRGEPLGDERPGYSRYVTREVYEFVEALKPEILKPFLSSDRPLEFRARQLADVESAKQESDVINYLVREQPESVAELEQMVNDFIMQHNMYGRVVFDERVYVEEEEYIGLDPIERGNLLTDVDEEEIEIISERQRVETIQIAPPGPGAPPPPPQQAPVFDMRIRRVFRDARPRFYAIPANHIRVHALHTEVSLEDCEFIAIREIVSKTELLRRFPDKKGIIDDLSPGIEEMTFDFEEYTRRNTEDEHPYEAPPESDKSMEKYLLVDAEIMVDWDGDGVAERRRVIIVDNEILLNEVIPETSFFSAAAIPQSHRHIGLSPVDAVFDLQLLSTQYHRQLNDNLRKMNLKRKYLNESWLLDDGWTLDLMQNTQAEYIFGDGPPVNDIYEEQPNSIVAEVLPAMNKIRDDMRIRTGLAADVAMNPDIMAKAPAHSMLGAIDAASKRIEMYIRIFGEHVMKPLALKLHSALRRHSERALTVEIRGEYVSVDPRSWRRRANLKVNVGLGYATKNQTLQFLMQLLPLQQQALGFNMATPMNVWSTLTKIIDAADIGHVAEFFTEPDPRKGWKPPEQKPDPQMLAAQAAMAEVQAKQQLGMAQNQTEQMKIRVDAMTAQIQNALDRLRVQNDAMVKQVESKLKAVEVVTKARLSELEAAKMRAETDETEAKVEVNESVVELNEAKAIQARRPPPEPSAGSTE